MDYREIFRTNDRNNPKFMAHVRGVRRGIRRRRQDADARRNALRTVQAMGLHAMQTHLAILEVETYFQQHYPGSGVDLAPFQ